MPLSTVTVTGGWLDPDNTPSTGVVTVEPVTPATGGGFIVAGAAVALPLVAGAVSKQLVSNTEATALQYRVTERIDGAPIVTYVITPTGATLDLSTAPRGTGTAIPLYVLASTVGQPNGLATLGADGKVTSSQLPVGGGSVPTSRIIATTNGLQGGGDLTTDRTFSPVYGSSAGTVCQGNDVRLSDARTPTGHTHPYSDITGTVPTSALPPLAINETSVVANEAAMLALTAQRGDMAIRQDNGRTYVLASDSPSTLADWKEVLAAGQVQSVAGKTGVVALVKGDVGLGNVDNTSDANKPVSTAQQTALDGKARKLVVREAYVSSGNINLNTGTSSWAPLPGGPTLSIPAAIGDRVRLDATIGRQANANLLADIGVVVGGVIKRWLGNGATSTPAAGYEGDIGLYHTNVPVRTGAKSFVVTSGDLDGANVVFAVLCKVNGAGSALLLASADNPLHWVAENQGPTD